MEVNSISKEQQNNETQKPQNSNNPPLMKLNQVNSGNEKIERQNYRENYQPRNNYKTRQYNNGILFKNNQFF